MNTKRIVIAEDDLDFARAVAERCGRLGVMVDIVNNGIDAITSIARHPPDLVILDIGIPQGDGESVFEQMSSNPYLSPIPVVFLSGASNEDAIHRCESMGAYYVLKGPDTWETLEPILQNALGLAGDAAPPLDHDAISSNPRVLVVDDDPDIVTVLKTRMASLGVDVVGASSGARGFWTALREKPDVIITDYTMPDGRADFLMRRLKGHPATRDLPIIVFSGRGGGARDYGLEREMRALGAVGYINKPLEFDRLWKMLAPLLPVDAHSHLSKGDEWDPADKDSCRRFPMSATHGLHSVAN